VCMCVCATVPSSGACACMFGVWVMVFLHGFWMSRTGIDKCICVWDANLASRP